MRRIVLPAPSNLIKVTFTSVLLFYPSTWYICDFFLFHIEIEGKGGWNIGGPKGMLVCWPPSQIIGGPAPLSSYAYVTRPGISLRQVRTLVILYISPLS